MTCLSDMADENHFLKMAQPSKEQSPSGFGIWAQATNPWTAVRNKDNHTPAIDNMRAENTSSRIGMKQAEKFKHGNSLRDAKNTSFCHEIVSDGDDTTPRQTQVNEKIPQSSDSVTRELIHEATSVTAVRRQARNRDRHLNVMYGGSISEEEGGNSVPPGSLSEDEGKNVLKTQAQTMLSGHNSGLTSEMHASNNQNIYGYGQHLGQEALQYWQNIFYQQHLHELYRHQQNLLLEEYSRQQLQLFLDSRNQRLLNNQFPCLSQEDWSKFALNYQTVSLHPNDLQPLSYVGQLDKSLNLQSSGVSFSTSSQSFILPSEGSSCKLPNQKTSHIFSERIKKNNATSFLCQDDFQSSSEVAEISNEQKKDWDTSSGNQNNTTSGSYSPRNLAELNQHFTAPGGIANQGNHYLPTLYIVAKKSESMNTADKVLHWKEDSSQACLNNVESKQCNSWAGQDTHKNPVLNGIAYEYVPMNERKKQSTFYSQETSILSGVPHQSKMNQLDFRNGFRPQHKGSFSASNDKQSNGEDLQYCYRNGGISEASNDNILVEKQNGRHMLNYSCEANSYADNRLLQENNGADFACSLYGHHDHTTNAVASDGNSCLQIQGNDSCKLSTEHFTPSNEAQTSQDGIWAPATYHLNKGSQISRDTLQLLSKPKLSESTSASANVIEGLNVANSACFWTPFDNALLQYCKTQPKLFENMPLQLAHPSNFSKVWGQNGDMSKNGSSFDPNTEHLQNNSSDQQVRQAIILEAARQNESTTVSQKHSVETADLDPQQTRRLSNDYVGSTHFNLENDSVTGGSLTGISFTTTASNSHCINSSIKSAASVSFVPKEGNTSQKIGIPERFSTNQSGATNHLKISNLLNGFKTFVAEKDRHEHAAERIFPRVYESFRTPVSRPANKLTVRSEPVRASCLKVQESTLENLPLSGERTSNDDNSLAKSSSNSRSLNGKSAREFNSSEFILPISKTEEQNLQKASKGRVLSNHPNVPALHQVILHSQSQNLPSLPAPNSICSQSSITERKVNCLSKRCRYNESTTPVILSMTNHAFADLSVNIIDTSRNHVLAPIENVPCSSSLTIGSRPSISFNHAFISPLSLRPQPAHDQTLSVGSLTNNDKAETELSPIQMTSKAPTDSFIQSFQQRDYDFTPPAIYSRTMNVQKSKSRLTSGKKPSGCSVQHGATEGTSLLVPPLKRKKRPACIPWRVAIAKSAAPLPTTRCAESQWAAAVNSLPEKNDDELEPNDTTTYFMVHARKRLKLTTQLMQTLIAPVPAALLHSRAIADRESATFIHANIVLREACRMIGGRRKVQAFFESGTRSSKHLDLSGTQQEVVITQDWLSEKVADDFMQRAKQLERDLARLGTQPCTLEIMRDMQQLDKLSITNRLVTRHSKEIHNVKSSSGSGRPTSKNASRDFDKTFPCRYVRAFPMPPSIPQATHLMSL